MRNYYKHEHFDHPRGRHSSGRRAHQRQPFGYGLQAYLLVLLKEQASYGYQLRDSLQIFGFEPEQFDISTIYRNLRSMEKNDLVVSDWSDSSTGPQKRIYTITHDGEIALTEMMEHLKKRQTRLAALLAKYEDIV